MTGAASPRPMSPRPMRELRVDPAAIRGNVERIRALVAPAAVMVVVKADAYGHGAELAARAAAAGGADWIGVADVDEALALRAAGIRLPMLAWLHGPHADLAAAAAAGVDVAVSSLEQLDVAARSGATVQVKIDSGLSRNGVPVAGAPALLRRAGELARAGSIRLTGVLSHLSTTSADDDLGQLEVFDRLVAGARAEGIDPGLRHIAASGAALALPAARLDLVRIGIAAYGLEPGPGIDVGALGLRPAMEVSAAVALVKRVPAGSGVSYGWTHRAERETTLALLPVGYAEGVPRAASSRAEVLIAGRRHPVVGRIAMDQLVVDVGDAPVRDGDRAVLWGDPETGAPTADDWGGWADTIGYEIVTRAGGRLTRTVAP